MSAPTPKRQPQAKHFLCFPLVTDESVLQLTNSLAYFRSITTPSSVPEPDATTVPDEQQGAGKEIAEPLQTNAGRQRDDSHMDKKLRLLPETAHRPPGTYHLTLGTMNLSEQEDMEKALALLQNIDYLALLRDAESGGGSGLERHRRAAQDFDELKHAESTPKHQEQAGPEDSGLAEQPSSTTSTAKSGKTTVDEIQEPGEMTKDVFTSPLQLPKSLTRAISPPPPLTSAEDIPPPSSSSRPVVPLCISLHSLGVFPNPRSARVFFAEPDDPTSRLTTFGRMIRKRFRDAGLIKETRPLVLHATVANLVYVKHREKAAAKAKGKGRAGGQALTVDSREILQFFNGETGAGGQGEGRGDEPAPLKSDKLIALDPVDFNVSAPKPSVDDQDDRGTQQESKSTLQPQSLPQMNLKPHPTPYVWATDIPITSVRICKMGAEPSDKPGWGLEYRAIAEKVFMPSNHDGQER